MGWKVLGVGFTIAVAVSGCGGGHTEQILNLQKQISLLARQLEDAQKTLNILRETDKNLKQSLDATEAELSRLHAVETFPVAATKDNLSKTLIPVVHHEASFSPTPVRQNQPLGESGFQPAATVSCSQVWILLGKGKTEQAVAQALQIPSDRVAACEQQVGRGGGR